MNGRQKIACLEAVLHQAGATNGALLFPDAAPIQSFLSKFEDTGSRPSTALHKTCMV